MVPWESDAHLSLQGCINLCEPLGEDSQVLLKLLPLSFLDTDLLSHFLLFVLQVMDACTQYTVTTHCRNRDGQPQIPFHLLQH